MVGRLIEIVWLNNNCHGPRLSVVLVNNGGVQFHRVRDFKQDYFNSIPPTSQHVPADRGKVWTGGHPGQILKHEGGRTWGCLRPISLLTSIIPSKIR